MNTFNVQVSNSATSYPAHHYLSKVKLIAMSLLFVFAILMISAQPSYAGCVESGAKAAITAGVVAGGLLILDAAFGFPVTAATAGTATAAAIAAMKAAALAGLYGCADAYLWEKSSQPSPQSSR